MYRLPAAIVMVLTFACVSAWAQSTTNTSIRDRSPFENARAANASARGPASWVARARARHSGLIQSRVNADPQSVDRSADPSIVGNSGSTASTGGAGDLLGGLAGLLGGGTGGSLSDLLGLAGMLGIDTSNLGGLASGQPAPTANAGANTAAAGANTPTDTSTNQSDVAAAGAQDALAQLLALRDGLNGSIAPAQVRNDPNAGDALNSFGFPKNDPRAQQQQQPTTGTDQPGFGARLVDSWMTTVFTALTLGLQTPAFINSLADGIRSMFGIPAPAATDTGTGTTPAGGTPAGGGATTGNTGGGTTPGTGGGNAINTLGGGSIV